MIRAKVALAVGVLVVLGIFMLGTEKQWSTEVEGQSYDCGPAIGASWLMSGTRTPPPADDRVVASACGAVVDRSRVVVLTTMGAGGLLALVGWCALASRRRPGEQLAPGT